MLPSIAYFCVCFTFSYQQVSDQILFLCNRNFNCFPGIELRGNRTKIPGARYANVLLATNNKQRQLRQNLELRKSNSINLLYLAVDDSPKEGVKNEDGHLAVRVVECCCNGSV